MDPERKEQIEGLLEDRRIRKILSLMLGMTDKSITYSKLNENDFSNGVAMRRMYKLEEAKIVSLDSYNYNKHGRGFGKRLFRINETEEARYAASHLRYYKNK